MMEPPETLIWTGWLVAFAASAYGIITGTITGLPRKTGATDMTGALATVLNLCLGMLAMLAGALWRVALWIAEGAC